MKINGSGRRGILGILLVAATLTGHSPLARAGADDIVYKRGLACRFYQGAWTDGVDLARLKPDATQVLAVSRRRTGR